MYIHLHTFIYIYTYVGRYSIYICNIHNYTYVYVYKPQFWTFGVCFCNFAMLSLFSCVKGCLAFSARMPSNIFVVR